jgi:hypothetical protein
MLKSLFCFILLTFFCCLPEKSDNYIGVIKFVQIENQEPVVKIYNLDGSLWKRFLFSDNFHNEEINPFKIWPENSLLLFYVLKEEEDYYVVVVNQKNLIKKISKKSENLIFQTWDQHILKEVSSVEFDSKDNPIMTKNDSRSTKLKFNPQSFYYPVEIKDDWLLISDDVTKGWIKWKDKNGNLLISLVYD